MFNLLYDLPEGLVRQACVNARSNDNRGSSGKLHRVPRAQLPPIPGPWRKWLKSSVEAFLYLCEVRWLSRGAMSFCVLNSRAIIVAFLQSKRMTNPKFGVPPWIVKLAFLADLNALNVALQSRGMLVPDLLSRVAAFELKVRFWEAQLQKAGFTFFKRLQEAQPTDT